MRLYHAAAIALVGWYLMTPPTGPKYPGGNPAAPLSQWSKWPKTFRDHPECEHVLDRYRRLTKQKNQQTKLRYYQQAQCVSADDPRLKGD
jgi:hypothetical protein